MTDDGVAAGLTRGLARELEGWVAPEPRLEGLRRDYLDFIDLHGAAAARRDLGPEHLTASCFVFSADLAETLLCFHGKGRFWVQTGGHVEPGDPSASAAALREAREESGLTGLSTVPGVLDLDRHDLGARFGSCRTHWDVGFAARASRAERPRVSDESEDVAWFRVDALPEPLAGGVARRAAVLLGQLRST